MPTNSRPSGTITIPTYRQLLAHEVRASTRCWKTLDPETRTLTTLYWPVHDGRARVVPSALREYRRSHEFRGPCCLCPLTTPSSEVAIYTEAAIFIAESGPLAGHYVAQCARDRCEYLANLEEIYYRVGTPLKIYPLRGVAAPPDVFHHSEIELGGGRSNRNRSRCLRRAYAQAELASSVPPSYNDFRDFQKLNTIARPGLPIAVFLNLFTRCEVCGLVTTRHVFSYHRCSREIIDLTDETDSE